MKPLLVLFICLALYSVAHSESIRFSFDDWCPYSCLDDQEEEPHSKRPGYFAEILRAIYIPLGFEPEFAVRPWTRALEETRHGILDAALAPAMSEAPDMVFPEEEIGLLGWCFYTRSDDSWTYDGVNSLKSRTLGILVDNHFGDEVTAYINAHAQDLERIQGITGLDYLAQNTSKLIAGRIDTMLEEPASTDYHLFKSNLFNELRRAGCLESQKMFVAFSSANPRSGEYAKMFAQGMRRLRSTGELEEILSHYGMHDWRD